MRLKIDCHCLPTNKKGLIYSRFCLEKSPLIIQFVVSTHLKKYESNWIIYQGKDELKKYVPPPRGRRYIDNVSMMRAENDII